MLRDMLREAYLSFHSNDDSALTRQDTGPHGYFIKPLTCFTGWDEL